MTSGDVHIASFVLLCATGSVMRVLHYLEVFPEVEVVTSDLGGKVVFLIEASTQRRIAEIADALRDLPAVLSVCMVEHHVDTADAMLEELNQ